MGTFQRLPLGGCTLALLLTVSLPAGAAGPDETAPTPAPRAPIGSLSLGGAEIIVNDNAYVRTAYSPPPDSPLYVVAGVWVGARVDRGGGLATSVSASAYGFEFWSVDNPPLARGGSPDLLSHGYRVTARDIYTPDFLPDHVPLGVELQQEIVQVRSVRGVDWIDLDCTVRNVSSELMPGGWTLQETYVGMMLDGDVGLAGASSPFTDDLGGYVPAAITTRAPAPGRRGSLAYLYDVAGGGDDVDLQVGLVVRGDPVHAARIFNFQQDPGNDPAAYLLMRGNSATVPTIDPAPTIPSDYRVLLSVGPVDLAPGQERTYSFSLAAGTLVEPGRAAPAPVESAAVADLVVSSEAAFVSWPVGEGPWEIFAVTGRRVARADGSRWNLRTVGGRRVPSGVYFYRQAGTPATAGKIVVTR